MIHPKLNHRIERAAATWRWQCVVRSLAMVASATMLVALAIGGSALLGWANTPTLVYALLALTLASSGLAALVMIVRSLDQRLDRQWLAAAVESHEPPLMDRLNTLLELDQRPQDMSAVMYRQAIERQAASVIRKLPDRSPFSWSTTCMHVAVAALLALLTLWFYSHFQPIRLLADNTSSTSGEVVEEGDPQLTIPEIDPTNASGLDGDEASDPWGEIRISEPGRDLRVTRYEDVPLLIEAAADRPLADVYWSTAINVEDETRHELPASDDPRYGVFQPILQPDDLGLREWDLVYYRAVALAGDETRYESSTYFVEVIPTRDELDQLPEAAYQQLEQMTELIEQQQEVIRQTNRLTGANDPQQAKRRQALAEQENRIASSAEGHQVALENQLGQQATASFSDSIEAARESLHDAESALGEQNLSDAFHPEHNALMRLADARRHLADLVKANLDAFEPSAIEAMDDAQALAANPADPDFAELLEKLHREARETADAAAQLEAIAADQGQLVDNVRDQQNANLPPLAAAERDLGERLERLRSSHPTAFRDLATLSAQTDAALDRAADQLARASSTARSATEHAEDRLQQLAREMNRRHLAHELAQADTLQERLQANQQAYREIEDQPQQVDSDQLAKTTEQTQQLLDELQHASDFTELAKLLTPEMADQIRGRCDRIGRSANEADRSSLAGGIRKSLEQLSSALAKDIAAQGTTLDQQQIASQLEQMHDRSEGLASARESVQKALSGQRSIQDEAFMDRNQKQKFPSLAEQQANLEKEFGQAIEKNPTGFEQAMGQCQAAQAGMQQAAQSLRSSAPEAPQLANDAAKQLQKLDDALKQQQRHSGISDKQLVRDMLERMSERLENIAKNPDQVTPEQKQQTAGQCKSAGSQACKLAGQNPGQNPGQNAGSSGGAGGGQSSSAASGQENGESGDRQQQLEAASDRLAEAQSNEETASAARDLQQQLQSLAADLGAQQPGGQQSSRQQSAGQQSAGQQSAGQQSAGQQSGGQQSGGQQSGGQQSGGQQSGGQRPGEQQAGSRQSGGQSGQPALFPTFGADDALRPSGAQAIDRGLAQLESAARRSQQGTLTEQAAESLRRGGVADVVAGIQSRYGYNENSQAVVVQLTEEIADPSLPVDIRTLQQLREQIQSLQQDLTIQSQDSGDAQPTLHVDPASFPPDYRESIQEYFQKLSEER